MIVKLLSEHHLEFLSLKGGFRSSSEPTCVKMSNCWKPHAAAYMLPLQVHVLMFLDISHATTNDASAKNSYASTAVHVEISLTVSQKKTSRYHGNT